VTDISSPVSRVFGAAAFYGLLAVTALSAAPYGSVEPWWAAVVEVSIFALIGFSLIICALAGERFLAHGQEVFAPLGALALYAWLQSGTVSFDPFESRLFALKVAAVTATGALLTRHMTSERRQRAVVLMVVATGLTSSVFGIARQTMQRGAEGFVLTRLPAHSGYAQFVNQNHFAFLAEMTLGLLAGLALGTLRSRSRQRALIYVALAFPVWAALVLSNSRGGVIAMLCQALFLAATYDAGTGATGRKGMRDAAEESEYAAAGGGPRLLRLVQRFGLTGLLLAALALGIIWVGGDPLAEHFEATRTEIAPQAADSSGVRRAEIWRATWEMFKENPAAGVGLGAYWVAISHYHRASGAMVPQQAHNDYLELAASGGIPGLALLLAFLLLLVRRARARLSGGGTCSGRAAVWGALAGLAGIAAHSFVDFGLHVTVNALVAAALLAIVSAEAEPGREARGDSSLTRPQA
jgi:O-antigen ligase